MLVYAGCLLFCAILCWFALFCAGLCWFMLVLCWFMLFYVGFGLGCKGSGHVFRRLGIRMARLAGFDVVRAEFRAPQVPMHCSQAVYVGLRWVPAVLRHFMLVCAVLCCFMLV